MKYTTDTMIGRKIQFFLGDVRDKFDIIEDVNEYGWFIKMTNTVQQYSDNYVAGDVAFFSHTHHTFNFKFVD